MSVNKVILVGNVGKDPDIRYFDNNNVKASFTLATSERGYTSSSGTQVPERTEWHNVICWRGLAQIVERFVVKGTQVYVEGKIRTRSFEDQHGVKKYITEIYADAIEVLNKRNIPADVYVENHDELMRAKKEAEKNAQFGEDPATEGDNFPF